MWVSRFLSSAALRRVLDKTPHREKNKALLPKAQKEREKESARDEEAGTKSLEFSKKNETFFSIFFPSYCILSRSLALSVRLRGKRRVKQKERQRKNNQRCHRYRRNLSVEREEI
tara:strand:+ start:66 stop:410 length:345 start_codon:yes stop_codon:yes gene_type:complete